MKKALFFAVPMLVSVMTVKAQIVNNGFENWTDFGAYMEPLGYA